MISQGSNVKLTFQLRDVIFEYCTNKCASSDQLIKFKKKINLKNNHLSNVS